MSVGESVVPRAGSSGGVAGGCTARPLSGVWALLARLRRSPSQDSLSSAGSDDTISFAFLSPPVSTHPQLARDPAPLTDTYKKRVRDRNARRHRDRDLTLHRKYGLPRGDATFDAFSLPHLPTVRRSLAEPPAARERRAASESLPRCAAHVPGKRRAPLPPRPASFVHTVSLGRRHSRKRPAPQPPANTQPAPADTGVGKENIDTDTLVKMKPNKSNKELLVSKDSHKYMPEKSSKNGNDNTKVPKIKREKSFLQQIFEGRKRSSVVEPPPERLLPSISELDKQAAEIIETYRLKPLTQNNRDNTTPNKGDAWFCTRCLRKYNSSVVTCLYCLPEQNNLKNTLTANHYKNAAKDTNIYTQIEDKDVNIASSSGVIGIDMDEKQKLKDMLKEMKYSLPKRSKNDTEEPKKITKTSAGQECQESKAKNIPIKIDKNNESNRQIREISDTGNKRDSYYDPVTLRIGSAPENAIKPPPDPQPSSSKQVIKKPSTKNEVRLLNVEMEPVKETAVITQPVVMVAPHPKHHGNVPNKAENNINSVANTSKVNLPKDVKPIKQDYNDSTHSLQNTNKNINSGSNNPNESVKLSSLLNPMYVPQQSNNIQDRRRLFFSDNVTPIRESKSVSKSGESGEKQGASTTTPVTVAKQSTSINLESTKENVRRDKEITPSVKRKEQSKVVKESTPPKVQHYKPETSAVSHNPQPNYKPPSTSTASTSTSNTPISENFKTSNANMVKMSVDQHSKRREWVNQLEQSIAKGDEKAAAEAAAKLAQLRLACSVLSFSSQIVGEPSKTVTQNSTKPQNTAKTETNINKLKPEPTQSTLKVNAAVHSMEIVSPKNVNNASSKEAGSAIKVKSQSKLTTSSVLLEPSTLLSSSSKPDPSAKVVAGQSSSKSEKSAVGNGSNFVCISIWVEDRDSTRGPVRLSIPRACTLQGLRRRAETALGLRAPLQRWIVGRALCTEDSTPLAALAGPDLAAPFYLCVVADTETKQDSSRSPPQPAMSGARDDDVTTTRDDVTTTHDDVTTDVYSQLVQLERHALVPNVEPFQCAVCMEHCAVNAGAVLRECVHVFCRDCLSDLVLHCAEPTVPCPALGCGGALQEREVRAVVTTDQYERWLARGLAAAESGSRNAFHCRTRDCSGWALCEPGVTRFPCPVCNHTNCVPCQAIHEGETCSEHRTRLQSAAAAVGAGAADTDEGTRDLLHQMVAKGEALHCPECAALITKKWGCDWVKCSACKTEICWVTRGRRWGPGGRGDTSAGCRCGVGGQRCHPSCGYCH